MPLLAAAQAKINDPNRPPGAGAARFQLADQKRIRIYSNGSTAKVVEVVGNDVRVEIVSGEDSGDLGWVNSRFLSPIK